jgi:hypothetical protein
MGVVSNYEAVRMAKLADLIRQLEKPPVKILNWLMWFWEKDFDGLRFYLLRELGYADVTGTVLITLFNKVLETVEENSPEKAWPRIAVAIGRENSRVMYFNMQLPVVSAGSVVVLRDQIQLAANEARASEFEFEREDLSILNGLGDLPSELLWKAKVRIWWD